MSRSSTSKPKKSKLPSDVTPFWQERGYRADIAALRPAPDDDPAGEEAYQRAFLQLAQYRPPRLPNPSHYPNSPSACEYMRKKNAELQGLHDERRDGAPSGQQVNRRFRDPDQSPVMPGNSTSSTSPASNYSATANLPPPSFMSTPRTTEEPANQYAFQPQFAQLRPPQSYQPGARLEVMEPFGAPSGPINKLR